ncbi:sarcinarray family MAST domain-containing protein [Methanosarcina sp. MSH10X1]|uniref:sarcinarray family MAST domain-containing protein n=1 Tax=Methanosarcina sp. MSH10X1 TaxID=2507075 RepID=UPI000FFC36F1|nr:sarcinarray family MAST domain-containing protein [Methanosarcina sp. MSH10X1]RXA20084.1 sarcinarray family MAST domain-containing protein [Methanosarcina sp. MSH10X1]
MKLFFKILLLTLGLIIFTEVGTASNPYGDIYEYDLYFNGKLLDVNEVPHLTLKIGEPFKVRVDFTVYERYYVSTMISEIGKGNFVIIDGPTKRTNDYCGKVIEKNSTEIFEWTVAPTKNWAGGSLPIDFVYQIDELGAGGKTLVNSGFTIAYPSISNEYYEGETPTSEQHTSEDQPTQEQSTSENSSSPTASAPAFSLVTAILALALAFFRFFHQ